MPKKYRPVLAAALVMLTVATITAQSTTRTRAQMVASYNERKADFEYLLGNWEFTGHSLERGDVHGHWNAARLAESYQVMDVFRITGTKDKTAPVTTTLRAYDVIHDRWELVSTEEGVGLQNFGTGQRHNGEMHIEQTFLAIDLSGKVTSSVWRIRYHDISADRFLWSGDRSPDGGKTWQKDFMTLDVRRVGPARTIDPLGLASAH